MAERHCFTNHFGLIILNLIVFFSTYHQRCQNYIHQRRKKYWNRYWRVQPATPLFSTTLPPPKKKTEPAGFSAKIYSIDQMRNWKIIIPVILLQILATDVSKTDGVSTSRTMMVSKNVQRRQVTDATKDSTVDPSITDPKAIQADKIVWWSQDPDQQDHIRLHWYVVFFFPLDGYLIYSYSFFILY